MYLIIQTMVMCTYSLCVQRMCHLYIQLMCAVNVSFVHTAYVCRECVICMYSLCVQRMCHLYVQLMCADNVSFVRTAYVCRECVICTYSLCVQRMCHLITNKWSWFTFSTVKWCLLHLTKYKSGQEISNLAK